MSAGERLSRGTFDQLAGAIWGLGTLTMRHMLRDMPVPSVMKGQIDREGLCIEPHFLITHAHPQSLEVLPRELGVTISETEPYANDENFTMYSYEKLELHTRRRTLSFTRGVALIDPLGKSVELSLELPSPGKRRRAGTKKWREERQELEKVNFGQVDAERFIEIIDRVTLEIQVNKQRDE